MLMAEEIVTVDRIPAVNLKNGDTVVEPSESYVLVSDVYSQFLILMIILEIIILITVI